MTVSIYTDDIPVLGQDSNTFSTNNQNYVYYVSNLAPEINSTVEAINTSETNAEGHASDAASFAVQASASATEANEAKSVCLTSSNIVGAWVGSSGAATKGGAYFHNSGWWGLLNDVPNIAATEPSDTNSDWGFINQGVQAVRVPIPVAPLNGASNISVTPLLEAEPYGNAFGTARAYREFQIDIGTGDFSSPIYTPTPIDEDNHTTTTTLSLSSGYKWRCRDVSVLGEVSEWMPVQSFSTGAVSIQAPTITVDGEPSDVPEQPFITSSAFVVNNGTDMHLNTIRTIRRQSDGVLVWNPGADTVNLTTVQVPQSILQPGITYIMNVTYTGVTYGLGETGVKVVTTATVFSTPVDDVFSTYVYEGNGSTQNIVNGIDLAGEGGMVCVKSRTEARDHVLASTVRGITNFLSSNITNVENTTSSNYLTSANSDGFSIGNANGVNNNGQDYVSHVFREAPNFFFQSTINHVNGVQSDVDASSLGAVGLCHIKRTDSTSDWWSWHKDLTAGNNLKLNEPDAQSTIQAYISVSGTTISFDSAAPTGTYILYAWAHDTDTTNGVIQCSTYTGNGSADGPEINLGWEPQYLLVKRANSTSNWNIVDSIRGFTAAGVDTQGLEANTSDIEAALGQGFGPTPTGFKILEGFTEINASGGDYVFMAIRRPNKTPTSGAEVFAVDQGDGVSDPAFTSGFPVDLSIRTEIVIGSNLLSSRLTQGKYLTTDTTAAEVTSSVFAFDYMDAYYAGTRSTDYYSWMLKRAPGFMDVVCYEGDGIAGRAVNHGLGVVPELMIVKCRTNATQWAAYSGSETQFLHPNLTTAYQTSSQYWNDTSPSDTQFTLGNSANVNSNAQDFIAILFATLPGISKVGSYTGNGTTQDIDCEFVSGARFVMIKRTDSTGDWFIWDSLRGITVGNDPHLSLNTTAAQVSDDSIDPLSSGFTVNEIGTNINVNSANYIFLAIA